MLKNIAKAAGISLVALVTGCSSISGSKVNNDSMLNCCDEHKKKGYFEKCYDQVPEKASAALTCISMAMYAPTHHAFNQNEGDGLKECKNRVKGFTYGIFEGGALILEGAYNAAGVIFPLPSGVPFMEDTADFFNEQIYDHDYKKLDETISTFYYDLKAKKPLGELLFGDNNCEKYHIMLNKFWSKDPEVTKEEAIELSNAITHIEIRKALDTITKQASEGEYFAKYPTENIPFNRNIYFTTQGRKPDKALLFTAWSYETKFYDAIWNLAEKMNEGYKKPTCVPIEKIYLIKE